MWELPTKAIINNRTYAIRSDFRVALDIITVMTDPSISADEKGWVALNIFYPSSEDSDASDYEEMYFFDNMRRADIEPAAHFMNWFIDGGQQYERKSTARLMDWEQDFSLIVAPVNRVLGYESREREYLHWWTFLSAYMEIGDCLFANVVSTRRKKIKGKMDKADRDFYRRNKHLVDLNPKVSDQDVRIVDEWLE